MPRHHIAHQWEVCDVTERIDHLSRRSPRRAIGPLAKLCEEDEVLTEHGVEDSSTHTTTRFA